MHDPVHIRFKKQSNIHWALFSFFLFLSIVGLAFIVISNIVPIDIVPVEEIHHTTPLPEATSIITSLQKYLLDYKVLSTIYEGFYILSGFVTLISTIATVISLMYIWRKRRQRKLTKKIMRK